MERYARQTMITGWDQDRLTETTLLVVGTGLLARFTSLLAAAMGIGRLVLLGDGRVTAGDRRFFLADAEEGMSLARTWAEALRRVNPEVSVEFAHDVPCGRSFADLPRPDVVVEASQNLRWKVQAFGAAKHWGAQLMMAGAGARVGLYQVGLVLCRDLVRLQKSREDPLVCLTTAALMVEDLRRLRLSLGEEDRPTSGPVYMSLEALHKSGGGAVGEWTDPESPPQITLVGAGALGTWAGIGLGFSNAGPVELTVYDPDGVEPANLNRQVLFWDAINRPKARALAERLTALFPDIEAKGRVEAVTDDNLAAACGGDLVMCGPDTFAARALLHRGAIASQTPLVNSGTSAFGADVAAYVPGLSPCLECSLRVATVARSLGEAEGRARCAGVPEASVVTSSALAGALMAYEARAALAGRPVRGVVEYDGRAQGRRLGIRSVRQPCGCHQVA